MSQKYYRGQRPASDRYQKELSGLRQKNADLSQEVEYLRDLILGQESLPEEWALSQSEAAMFSFMMRVDIATKEALYAAMYQLKRGGKDVEIKIIDVFICKLRAKLPESIEIKTVWGQGYRLVKTPELVALIDVNNRSRREMEAKLDAARKDIRRPFEPIQPGMGPA